MRMGWRCCAVVILLLTVRASAGPAQTGGGYDLSWNTIAGGAGTPSSGGGFDLSGTIGQAATGTLEGGGFSLNGGFWAGVLAANPVGCLGDCGGNGSVTVDEVLLMVNIALDNAAFATCEAGDANSDHKITVDEILTAVNNALTACG